MTVGLLSLAYTPSGSSSWIPLRVGAGGFLRGMDLVTSDNTMVCRTDTYGAWLWNSALTAPNGGTGMWTQLCAPALFAGGDIAAQTPDGQESFTSNGGVYEITIAPSNTSILYMGFIGNLYKTTNKGTSWTVCPGWTRLTASEMPPNSGGVYSQCGAKMAIDPINPSRVFIGTGYAVAGVLQKSLDGGTTFSTISTGQVAAAASAGTGYCIAFDPRVSTQSGGNSNVIYVFSGGNGLYKSADAGVTWTIQNSAGMPTTCVNMKVNPSNGDVWIVSNNGTTQAAYKYNGSTWAHVTAATSTGVPYGSIAINPNNANQMILFQFSSFPSYLSVSADGGVTWTTNNSITLVSTDIPWLSVDHGLSVSTGFYDSTGKIFLADGVAVWSMPQPSGASAFNVTSVAAGIEQLITNQIISPPGGYPIVASWDRAVFTITNPKVYPSNYFPGAVAGSGEIVAGWGVDWASSDPTFICAYCDANGIKPAYSTDKGVTWTQMATSPPIRTGGAIAASTNQNMVCITSNNGSIYYTLNRGTTWVSLESYFNTNFSIPLISSGNTGWGNAYYDNRQYVCADRVAASTFYAFNDGGGTLGLKIFRSTDGGQTWGLQSSPTFVGFYGSLKSVPQLGSSTNTTGHLFFTGGSQGGTHPNNQPLYRSTDGGASWNPVTNVKEALAVGFGKNDQSSVYPAIGFYGWYNGVGGMWVSKDNAVSFTKIGELTLYGTSDIVSTLTGDANTANIWYVGLHNSGSAYYGP